ncbi:SecY-interacting protein [Shewanella waksmanii]|uniref:SecY-interacting protein n=1 Tax=Shewanella waksmanii TaxID=213783 RepID=UPI00048C1BAD|nr:SecY-interacting protein [Shewanella waksmanii]
MSSLTALENFINRYHQAYQESLGEPPRYYPRGEFSDCIISDTELSDEQLLKQAVHWQAVKRESVASFDNVERAMELQLSGDIDGLFSHYYSAPMIFSSPWGEGEIIQAWNQVDFEYLQQNLIGHLMMKLKLKQPPTWFFGILGQGDEMLVVDNRDGSVWVEIPGEEPAKRLADSVSDFLMQLTPRVAPPVEIVEESMPQTDHPGIWHRLKIMWRNLRGSR